MDKPQTWYRGEVKGGSQGSKEGHIYQLGYGLYLADTEATARHYASMWSNNQPDREVILKATIERVQLGRVLDLTTDPRWKQLMTRRTPSGVTFAALMRGGTNYYPIFQGFLQENNLKINDFDAIIGEDFAGGKQMCIPYKNGEATNRHFHIRALLRPVSKVGGGKPGGSTGGGAGESAAAKPSTNGQKQPTGANKPENSKATSVVGSNGKPSMQNGAASLGKEFGKEVGKGVGRAAFSAVLKYLGEKVSKSISEDQLDKEINQKIAGLMLVRERQVMELQAAGKDVFANVTYEAWTSTIKENEGQLRPNVVKTTFLTLKTVALSTNDINVVGKSNTIVILNGAETDERQELTFSIKLPVSEGRVELYRDLRKESLWYEQAMKNPHLNSADSDRLTREHAAVGSRLREEFGP